MLKRAKLIGVMRLKILFFMMCTYTFTRKTKHFRQTYFFGIVCADFSSLSDIFFFFHFLLRRWCVNARIFLDLYKRYFHLCAYSSGSFLFVFFMIKTINVQAFHFKITQPVRIHRANVITDGIFYTQSRSFKLYTKCNSSTVQHIDVAMGVVTTFYIQIYSFYPFGILLLLLLYIR